MFKSPRSISFVFFLLSLFTLQICFATGEEHTTNIPISDADMAKMDQQIERAANNLDTLKTLSKNNPSLKAVEQNYQANYNSLQATKNEISSATDTKEKNTFQSREDCPTSSSIFPSCSNNDVESARAKTYNKLEKFKNDLNRMSSNLITDTNAKTVTSKLYQDGHNIIFSSKHGTAIFLQPPSSTLWSLPTASTITSSLTALGTVISSALINGDINERAKNKADAQTCTAAGILSNEENPGFISSCLRWSSSNATSVPDEYGKFEYDTIPDLINAFKTENLAETLSSGKTGGSGTFNPNTPNINGNVYFDGVKISASYTYSDSGSTRTKTLVYSFTLNGETYSAEIQNASTITSLNNMLKKALGKDLGAVSTKSIDDQLNDFFKSAAGTRFLNALLKATVEEGPYSPVAGNPASYMAQLVKNDYNLVNRVVTPAGYVNGAGILSLSPGFDTMLLGVQAGRVYTLPVDYTYYKDENDALIFDFPLGVTQIGKTNSYNLGLGFGWKHNFLPNWSVTPAIHTGVEGSVDLTNGTMMYDGSVTSRYSMVSPLFTRRLDFALTDNLSFLQTGGLKVGGYSAKYDINNLITSNGLEGTYQFQKPMSLTVFYNNTSVLTGQKWYMSNYNEVGFKLNKLGYNVLDNGNFLFNRFSSGMGYLFGPKGLSGVTANFTFNF